MPRGLPFSPSMQEGEVGPDRRNRSEKMLRAL